MKKLTYGYVKEQIGKEGYKLLSKKYINSRTKLKIQCPKGHIFKMLWASFQQGQRCSTCSNKKKHTIQELKKQVSILASNYKLESIKYINTYTKLKFICPKGHKFDMTWSCFQQGQRCSKCCNNKRLTIKYIKKQVFILTPDYKLLSTEYKNSQTKLKFKCNKNHIYYVTWTNFKNGSRCPICYHKSRENNYSIDDLFKLYNYKTVIKQLTKQSYKNYYNIINPKNLNRSFRQYHLDHIFPIMEGFRLNIKPKIIANPNNLQMLWWRDNIIKSDKLLYNINKLYLEYYKFELLKR